MRTIELHFPKPKFLGKERIQRLDIPERYNELTARQFHLICSLTRAEVEHEDFIFHFFGLNEKDWKMLPPFYHYIFTNLISSLKSQSVSRFFDSYIKVGSQSRFLSVPSEMPLMQFMNADTMAQWYEFTKKDSYLIDFFCQLAMPDEDTDYLRHSAAVFREYLLQNIEDPSVRSLLLDTHINWQLIKSYLSAQFPNMFPSAEPGTNADPNSKQRPSNWYDVFDALIGEHLENIEAYKRVPAFDAFRIIDSRIRNKKFNS